MVPAPLGRDERLHVFAVARNPKPQRLVAPRHVDAKLHDLAMEAAR